MSAMTIDLAPTHPHSRGDELRSLNGQIEFVLRRVLQQEGRLKDKKEPSDAP